MSIRITVDGIVVKNDKVLLIKRCVKPFKGYWVLPGGAIRYGEQLKEAVEREVKEETGLKVKVIRYVGYFDDPGRDPRGFTISHAFVCSPIGGKLKGSFEGREIRWFKKLPKKIGFDHKRIVEKAGVLNEKT